jgi:hypothetical protein
MIVAMQDAGPRTPYVVARERFPAVVQTLPREYRETNAPQLLAIVAELEKSYHAELDYVEQVTDVSAIDLEAVTAVVRDLRKRRRRQSLSQERTHCGHIGAIADQMRVPYQDRRAERQLRQLAETLQPLRNDDNEILDDIEQILDRAIAAAEAMEGHLRSGQPADALAVQQAFAEDIDTDAERMKATINRMSELTGDLTRLM